MPKQYCQIEYSSQHIGVVEMMCPECKIKMKEIVVEKTGRLMFVCDDCGYIFNYYEGSE